MMGLGFFKAETRTGNGALPVLDATVVIKDNLGITLYQLFSDENGQTESVSLYAPDRANTLEPEPGSPPYATYIVEIIHPDYTPTVVYGIQVFDSVEALLPANMVPRSDAVPESAQVNIFHIPDNNLLVPSEWRQEGPAPNPYLLYEVMIPDYIIVHLGEPDGFARNVRIPFIDYIKNVASGEIYPTWPSASLESNIYSFITFALNRIYTGWYRNQGYHFDITSDASYDQAFTEGRNIFSNIGAVVNRIFNQFVRQDGYIQPFFTAFCNGVTDTCPGLSQWGTVPLANKGYSPIQILRNYYPDDIAIVESSSISGVPFAYPGEPLKIGSTGSDVETIQRLLNRISINYPLIPAVPQPNENYDESTADAVITFQDTFNLPQTGVVDEATWNRISNTYALVAQLASLDREKDLHDIGSTPPDIVLREGSRGPSVSDLHFILEYLSIFYPSLPVIIRDNVFRGETRDAVMAFQELFNMTPNGIVDQNTWNRLYQLYWDIQNIVKVPEVPTTLPTNKPGYPGMPLDTSSRGDDVSQIQTNLNHISNYYPAIPQLNVDGVFGPSTESAVRAFQQLFGLPVNGVVGPETWDAIVAEYNHTTPPAYPGTPLSVGSEGNDVLVMQRILNQISNLEASIPKLVEDGVFDGAMQNAVQIFQRLNGLPVNGVIGPETWDAIVSVV